MRDLIVVFCEGPHDVAFITRILKCACYKTYNVKIRDYPSPLNEIFEGALKNMEFAELKIDQVSSKLLPRKILKKEEQVVLLYALGGNRQFDRAQSLLETFNDIKPVLPTKESDELGAIGAFADLKISYIFFNDADNDINVELKKLNSFLQDLLKDSSFSLEHNQKICYQGLQYGAYFFSSDGKIGALENLLLEIMRDGNDEIFKDTEVFYEKLKYSKETKKLKVICKDGVAMENRNGDKFDIYQKKSVITIAGQLQNSGKSQVVIIEDTDYITLDKIKANSKAKEIIEFFNLI